jgi:hypothetical protein
MVNNGVRKKKNKLEVSQSCTLWQRVKKVLLHAVGLKSKVGFG